MPGNADRIKFIWDDSQGDWEGLVPPLFEDIVWIDQTVVVLELMCDFEE